MDFVGNIRKNLVYYMPNFLQWMDCFHFQCHKVSIWCYFCDVVAFVIIIIYQGRHLFQMYGMNQHGACQALYWCFISMFVLLEYEQGKKTMNLWNQILNTIFSSSSLWKTTHLQNVVTALPWVPGHFSFHRYLHKI